MVECHTRKAPATAGTARERGRLPGVDMAQGIKGSTPACSVERCEKPATGGRGWCGMHWWRWRHYGDPSIDPAELRRANRPMECSIDGCNRSFRARGYCATHWRRWKLYGDPLHLERQPVTYCSVDDCDAPHWGWGYCVKHHARAKRTGSVEDGFGHHGTLEDRFWRFVTPGAVSNCWEWTGSRNNHGYGTLGDQYAHRVSYELHRGAIPDGLVVLHQCDNPPCVNPNHLGMGTQWDNVQDARLKKRLRGRLSRPKETS